MRADAPLAYVGRFLGGAISKVYAEANATQNEMVKRSFGQPGDEPRHAWYRADPPPPGPLHTCRYTPRDVAYKRALSESLLDDLGQLADRTFLVLLPDATLLDPDPRIVTGWERHLELHRELADAREHVTLIDLSVPVPAENYSDGFHLSLQAGVQQRRLFFHLLRKGGHLP
jgi:hypothetical protein